MLFLEQLDRGFQLGYVLGRRTGPTNERCPQRPDRVEGAVLQLCANDPLGVCFLQKQNDAIKNPSFKSDSSAATLQMRST